jgi:outer membrane receptor protein involved in Fe transport
MGSLPCAAWAQEQTAAVEPASTGPMQEVTVTATRREESLSRVPLSVTAMTQDQMDAKGIKDIQDVARFTPGIEVDNSGTSNISIRGIASSGGAGTTGIYIDDTPIQMRALAFNPDETLPKSFDIERIEVLRGPQGTLFGAGSEGGTVRYLTTPPSLSRSSTYGRTELSYTEGGEASLEAGVAAGGPVIDNTLGVRATVWYRYDGGWIDRVNPTADDPFANVVDRNANHGETYLIRLGGLWKVNDRWSVTPSIYFQKRDLHNVSAYWPIYSNPAENSYVSGDPTGRPLPDTFYLPAVKIEGDFGAFRLISNTSFYHREEQSGYEGTIYNLGFYQALGVPFLPEVSFPLIDGSGIHLPASIANYRSPASVDNGQQNIIQEIRLVSSDPSARLLWTTGIFFAQNRQTYLEQIHDPQLNDFWQAVAGLDYTDVFPVPYDPAYPTDSYFLSTHAEDKQIAWYGEGTYSITDQLKATVGLRYSWTEFSFETLTGGPQLYDVTTANSGDKKEGSFTPKVSLAYQLDPNDLLYFTYAKGFRPGGANNPLPPAACADDFAAFGITAAPTTYNSDTVDSFEIGSKNNLNNRIRIATSLYYIKWHNIQQTVVPPICQISFIANLGEATAWGGDIQADLALSDSFSAEITAGYTDARYTQDAKLSPDQTVPPIVASGDAITGVSGQPAAPFTASIGLEYHFSLAQRRSFLRLDYEYEAHAKWLPPGQDPNSGQYDSANFTLPSTSFFSLRGGMQFGNLSVEPFIDNLTNTHPITNYTFSIDPGTGDTRLQRNFTFRPRTWGVTAVYRN